jgi:hypothetical protein
LHVVTAAAVAAVAVALLLVSYHILSEALP